MYIRPCYRIKNGKRHAYWALVESYRSKRGPRQRIVAYLGQTDEPTRRGIKQVATGEGKHFQRELCEAVEPHWIHVDPKRVRVEQCLEFGGPWLAQQLLAQLGLSSMLDELLPQGREEIPWSVVISVLLMARFCCPSSELYIAEHFFKRSALCDLLGMPAEKLNDDRLYRALDQLLPHKHALEKHLKQRAGELFCLEYDLLLYDITSTYFEGLAQSNPLAKYGYSRDKRSDCKQVCIGLVVSKEGVPLGYELFAGNRHDSTTVEEMVETLEARYGQADRIWVMDRGMVCQENLAFLREGNRRYILGTPKSMLTRYEQALLQDDWQQVYEGLEVKTCASPEGQETFILCRSQDRRQKEHAMHQRFMERIQVGLDKIEKDLQRARRSRDRGTVERRIGRLLGRNTRAAGCFKIDLVNDKRRGSGYRLVVKQVASWRQWSMLSEGCYLLRSNIPDWSGEQLWKAYIQLTEAEAAFRIHKSDLRIRPIWHQRQDRVQAHILVCFLAYVLWKSLALTSQQKGLGSEPRRIIDELSQIRLVDVVLPTRDGPDIRRRCVTRPTDHQTILLQRLGLNLPSHLPLTDSKPDGL